VRAALNPDGIVVTQFNGSTAGQTVFHLHFHIIPRWEGVPLGRHASGGMADPEELKALAAQIAAKIS
jgi:histidine triad (HIT) family protein